MKKIRIVADSSADITELSGHSFETAPLKIITAERQFTDDGNLDVCEMLDYLASYKGKSSTSCPNPTDWLNAFSDGEWVFCVTITSALSGSYNSAVLAAREYEEMHEGRRVFVLDSRSTGPEMALIIDKICEMIDEGLGFDEIAEGARDYADRAHLIFMLESMKNLANNGRVKPIVAKIAAIAGIRLVGRASDGGELEPLSKCRGEKRSLESIVSEMSALGYKGGRVKIAHAENPTAAEKLSALVKEAFNDATVDIYPSRGLCSFYAERGGLLVGFEGL